MRWERRLLGMAAAAAIAGAPGIGIADEPAPAGGDQMQEQLYLMQQKLKRMEDQLDATNRRLADAQRQLNNLPEPAAPAPGLPSGVAGFLERLQVGGWVAGSYFYNINDPDNDFLLGANTGAFGTTAPFRPDDNSFSFDQLWFELEHPVDPQHRAGFRADIVMGKTAEVLNDLNTGFFERDRTFGANGSFGDSGAGGDFTDFYVYQAYAQYLAPLRVEGLVDGVHLKAGKFATLLGYEVVPTSYNNHITRGLVFNLLQPIDHVGVLASANVGEGGEFALGLVNGFGPSDPDTNDFKTLLGRIGYSGDGYGVRLNAIWGADDPRGVFAGGPPTGSFGDEEEKTGVLDLVLTADPTDKLHLWANGDLLWAEPEGGNNAQAWGVALGSRYAFTDRMGLALRGEYVQDNDGILTAIPGFTFAGGNSADATLWSVTATADYSLTQNLLVRVEGRWDRGSIENLTDGLFISDEATRQDQDNQALIGGEVVYSF